MLFGRHMGGKAFPGLQDIDQAARIELAQGRAQLVLHRRRDTGQWEIASAEDAPASADRIALFLQDLAALKPGEGRAPPSGEPMTLRVSDREGKALAEAELWPGVLRLAAGGPSASTGLRMPSLDPAQWSALEAPRIAAIRAILRPAAGGLQPVAGPEAAALEAALSRLQPDAWVPARQLNWAGATYYQIETDAGLIEAQVTDTPDGRFVRLTAESLPGIRRLRAFAFRLPDAP